MGRLRNPVSYRLQVREKGTAEWRTFVKGVAPDVSGNSAELGEFDPTVLKNGVYELRLYARDASGNSAEDTVSVILDGGLKLGQVNFSAEDISMPQPGFPVSLVRTYDSRSTGDGDFGPGWNLPSSEAKVAATNDFSKHWDTNVGGSSFVPTYWFGGHLT